MCSAGEPFGDRSDQGQGGPALGEQGDMCLGPTERPHQLLAWIEKEALPPHTF